MCKNQDHPALQKNWFEYSEESKRFKATCYHADSTERQSVITNVTYSQGVKKENVEN